MLISTSLKYYKRKEIKEVISFYAKSREIGVMFGKGVFGKRPEALFYPDEILDFAKKKATSFHCSEERWSDPLSLSSGLKRSELNALRSGWDLIFDIDCPIWELSKITAILFVKALQAHNIKSVSVKFSGNKGFHIAVPFEAFPEYVFYKGEHVLVKNYFPEFPRLIAKYILNYIQNNFIKIIDNYVYFLDYKFSFNRLQELFNLKFDELTYLECSNCKRRIEKKTQAIFICDHCGYVLKSDSKDEIHVCPKCNHLMRLDSVTGLRCSCGSETFTRKLDILKIIEVDTILIASRHMFRMPYSLHEKSGLVSVPIGLDEIYSFDRDSASPDKVVIRYDFLDSNKTIKGEASSLLINAINFSAESDKPRNNKSSYSELYAFEDAISESLFPPCIKNIKNGLEDGRKRALFILLNFLINMNWPKDKIKDFIYKWNKNNVEALRETVIKTQFNYRLSHPKILPPNCSTKGYYKELGVCSPDELCSRIKNPVQYAKIRFKLNSNSKKKRSKKKTESKNDSKMNS